MGRAVLVSYQIILMSHFARKPHPFREEDPFRNILGTVLHVRRTVLRPHTSPIFSPRSSQVRLASRVLFKQSVSTVHVFEDLLYLLSEKTGKVLCLDLDGKLLATVAYPSVRFSSLALTAQHLVLGSDSGDVYAYSLARLEFLAKLPCPLGRPPAAASVSEDGNEAGSAPLALMNGTLGGSSSQLAHRPSSDVLSSNADPGTAILDLQFGMNGEYIFVIFWDASFAVAHLPTASYTSLKLGHLQPVQSLPLAPCLELAVTLAARLVDPDQHVAQNALSFVSLSRDDSFLTWPAQGAPFRTKIQKLFLPKEFESEEVESFVPGPHLISARGGAAGFALVCAGFRRVGNQVALDGRLNGSYQLLGAGNDGALYLYDYVDARPPPRIGGVGDGERRGRSLGNANGKILRSRSMRTR